MPHVELSRLGTILVTLPWFKVTNDNQFYLKIDLTLSCFKRSQRTLIYPVKCNNQSDLFLHAIKPID